MNEYLLLLVLMVCAIVVEYLQHKDYAQKHPDYEKCPSGVLMLVFIAVFILAKIIGVVL